MDLFEVGSFAAQRRSVIDNLQVQFVNLPVYEHEIPSFLYPFLIRKESKPSVQRDGSDDLQRINRQQ